MSEETTPVRIDETRSLSTDEQGGAAETTPGGDASAEKPAEDAGDGTEGEEETPDEA